MSAQNNTPSISKTPGERLVEVFHALLIIKDLVKLVEDGAYYHMPPIYGQLRALLTDRTQKGAKKPLFLEILDALEPDAKIYYIDRPNPSLLSGFGFSVSTLLMSVERKNVNQSEIKLAEILEKNVLTIGAHSMSLRAVIDTYSDKYGGSHYDKTIPEYLFDIKSIGFNSPNIIFLHLSRLLVQLWAKILERICNFEIITAVFFKKRKQGEYAILSLSMPSGYCQISFYSNGNDLDVLLVDATGRTNKTSCKDILNDDSYYFIDVSYEINRQLEGILNIRANGQLVSSTVLVTPLLMNNDFNDYEMFFNRTAKVEKQDFEFGTYAFMSINSILPEAVREYHRNEIVIARATPIQSYWYGIGGFGYKIGNGDMHNIGNVSLGIH